MTQQITIHDIFFDTEWLDEHFRQLELMQDRLTLLKNKSDSN